MTSLCWFTYRQLYECKVTINLTSKSGERYCPAGTGNLNFDHLELRVMCWLVVLLQASVLCVVWCVGRIVEPTTSELYLRSGDRLHLVCEQRVTQTNVEKVVYWSKAETKAVSVKVSDDELRYQQIDTSQPAAPYTINQRPADDGGDLLRSELVKNNVGRADSGYYRCRLGLGGESSRILITVIDSTSSSHHVSVVSRK